MSGALGRLVIEELLARIPAERIVAVVRDPAKAQDLAACGVALRVADYNKPESLAGAFRAGDVVLLISGSEVVGQGIPQHTAVVDAAKAAGVARIAYTGMLGGPAADFLGAAAHKGTEQIILDSGLPYTFLRNGLYTEIYTDQIAIQLEHGVIGSTGGGRVGSATRQDYAAAAAAVLLGEGHENEAYELSGDEAWSLAEYVAELSKQSGKEVAYADVQPEELRDILLGVGLPEAFADIVVDLNVSGISRGLLQGGNGDMSRLIGRPTTPLTDTIAVALTGLR